MATAPSGSGDPAGPGVDLPVGGPGEPAPTAGPMDWVADLAPPLGYLAAVIFVAMLIARRRVGRSERLAAAPAAGPVDLDALPVRRTEPSARPTVPEEEENMPRWLRPSLRAERYGMDVSQHRELPAAIQFAPPPPTRTPLAFGSVPADLDDRLVIQAASVALVGQPGPATGEPIMQLERGDEVAILERVEGWLNVLTPTGVAGWVPADGASAEAQANVAPSWPPSSAGGRVAAPTPADGPIDLAALFAAARSHGPAPAPSPPEETPSPLAGPASEPERPKRARRRARQDPGLA